MKKDLSDGPDGELFALGSACPISNFSSRLYATALLATCAGLAFFGRNENRSR